MPTNRLMTAYESPQQAARLIVAAEAVREVFDADLLESGLGVSEANVLAHVAAKGRFASRDRRARRVRLTSARTVDRFQARHCDIHRASRTSLISAERSLFQTRLRRVTEAAASLTHRYTESEAR